MDESDPKTLFPSAVVLGKEELLWHLKRAQSLAQMGSWEWNFRTRELVWSDETFGLFGLPIDTHGVKFSAFLERVHPDDRDMVEKAVKLAADQGADYAHDHRILGPGGEIRVVHVYGEVERDPSGAPLRMRGIIQDVSRLRAVERSATRNRDMLSGMFRISPEAIVVANEEGRVVILSAGAEAVFGFAAHEIVGGSIERLMPERFRGNHGRHVTRFAEGARDNLRMAERKPIQGLRKDNVEIPIEASVARIVAGGETFFITIVRDLTDQYETEARLVEARDRAEQASTAKSTFLANMSHELRTPLNGILGIAEALGGSAADQRQKEMVDLIAASARALEALLTDILDLAQIEAGRMEIQHLPFDLGAMVRNVAALFRTSARSKGLSIELDLPEAACGDFVGDEHRLRQVLNNLLSNAVKFTAVGEVKLSVEIVRSPSPEVRFTVKDTGIGFDEETRTRLFHRFEQADSSITRRFGGSGLGLSICKDLSELMNGTIQADSRPGEGATFVFQVPLAPAGAGSRTIATGPEFVALKEERTPNILLAEDHPTNRRVVELILEPLGVDLFSVENGALAVAEAASGNFDLILMDMQMPVMDGLEAVRRIREREREGGLRRVPICMLTANALPDFRILALDAGADDFLTKPISAHSLLDRVSALSSAPERLSEGAD
ncbi:MAG: ATP-binding protein [Allosphingosinicella sp.]